MNFIFFHFTKFSIFPLFLILFYPCALWKCLLFLVFFWVLAHEKTPTLFNAPPFNLIYYLLGITFHKKVLACSSLLSFLKDCESQYAPILAPALGFRCATCVLEKVRGMIYSWRSVCSKPSDEVLDHCSAAWAKTCSCGQLKLFPPATTFLPAEQQHGGDGIFTPDNNLLRSHARITSNKDIQDEHISPLSGENFASSFQVDSLDATLDDGFFGFSSENSHKAQDNLDVDNGGNSAFRTWYGPSGRWSDEMNPWDWSWCLDGSFIAIWDSSLLRSCERPVWLTKSFNGSVLNEMELWKLNETLLINRAEGLWWSSLATFLRPGERPTLC